MKKVLIPNSLEQIKLSFDYIDGYIIGIKDMSVNTFYNIDIENIDEIKDLINDKDAFISLNKNMENKDIDILKDTLVTLKKYPIAGVLYSDVSFVNLKEELELNYPLIWNHEHFSTNYETINYWNGKGVDSVYLSSDIPLKDMLEIRKNCPLPLFINILGYLPMFVSKRHIVKNYLKKFNLKDSSYVYYMEKEDNIYPIIDNNIGTQVFSSKVFNGTDQYEKFKDAGFEYGVINGFLIDNNKLVDILKLINQLEAKDLTNISSEINKLLSNIDTGFMYQETLSRVKKNDK